MSSVKLTAKEGKQIGKTFKVQMMKVKLDIPLFIVFRALGVVSDYEICSYILPTMDGELADQMLELLKPSIEEADLVQNQKLALEFIAKYISGFIPPKSAMTSTTVEITDVNRYKLKYTLDTILTDLFPHVGSSPNAKCHYLGYMTHRLLCNILRIAPYDTRLYDDRDSFINKRIEKLEDRLESGLVAIHKKLSDIEAELSAIGAKERPVAVCRSEFRAMLDIQKKEIQDIVELTIRRGFDTHENR
jgi:DNA-directed RNA polymerase II subunit RPB2